MTSVIEYLIKSQEDQEATQREEAKRRRDDKAANLLEGLKKHLGAFFSVIEERKIPIETTFDGSDPRIRIEIPALDEERLAPIVITWSGYASYTSPFQVMRSGYSNLPEALKAARDNYDRYLQSQKSEKIESFEKRFAYYSGDLKTEEQARALFEEYVGAFPEADNKARELLSRWIEKRAEDLKIKEAQAQYLREREAEEVRIREEGERYIGELVEWLQKRDAIDAKNFETGKKIQEIADSFFYTVYKLTYALVASMNEAFEDESEERYLETREVYSLEGEPDSLGYWKVGKEGKLVKFFHPVSVEMLAVKASSGILSKTFRKAGVELSFSPYSIPEKIPEIMSEIEDLPEKPARPSFIHEYDEGRYITEAYKRIRGEKPSS
jgi:hypothetical protein